MATKHKPSEYLHIKAWGLYLGSFPAYIRDEQERAAEAGAPLNALSERRGPDGVRTGEWRTADQLHNITRAVIERSVKELGKGKS